MINHSFDAKPETVFDMWTDSEHLRAWLPPKGFTMEFMRSEVKEGESAFYRMFNEDGVEIYGLTNYLQIVPKLQIVMRQDFCDQDENLTRHPLAPELPQSIISTVQFSPEGQGTRVTLTSVGSDSATAKEITWFLEEREGMNRGWSNSFDQLDKNLH